MGTKKSSIGCLFWVALILFVIVIVLANLKTADRIIKQTGFNEVISELFKQKKSPSVTEPPAVTDPPVVKKKDTDTKNNDIIEIVKENENPEEKKSVTEKKQQEKKEDPPVKKKKTTDTTDKKYVRKAMIYFVKVNPDGNILLKGFERKVYFDDSPLKDTISTLLEGPKAGEINNDFYSMIPENTRLNNIYVKGSTAFIDFSENFRFNPLGKDGLKAQLNQVVYTATEFSNVKNVQVLIDGKKVDYLGPEGVYIGQPLSRESLIAAE